MHLVTEDVDSGPILAQEAVPVLDGDTEATLHERIKEVERRCIPDVIEQARRRQRIEVYESTKIKRALLSVYDKTGLVELARALHELGVELVSSGNTSAALEASRASRSRASKRSPGSPEMLDGRVKTLHPKIHGGLLADLGNESHRDDLDLHGIRAVRARRVEPLSVPAIDPTSRRSTSADRR